MAINKRLGVASSLNSLNFDLHDPHLTLTSSSCSSCRSSSVMAGGTKDGLTDVAASSPTSGAESGYCWESGGWGGWERREGFKGRTSCMHPLTRQVMCRGEFSVLEDTQVSACAAACDGEKKGGWKFKSRRRRGREEYQRARRISNMPFDGDEGIENKAFAHSKLQVLRTTSLRLSCGHIIPQQTFGLFHVVLSDRAVPSRCSINNTEIFRDEDILDSDSVRERRGGGLLGAVRQTDKQPRSTTFRAGIPESLRSLLLFICSFLSFQRGNKIEKKMIVCRKKNLKRGNPRIKQGEEGLFGKTLCYYLSRGEKSQS